MALSAPKPCGYPGCGMLVQGKPYCDRHSHITREQDNRRGSSSQRGYGYRWQKASKTWLKQHPLCEDCQSRNVITSGTVVDHKTPHRGDMALFWDSSNWQSLCAHCHNSHKQRQEKNFSRPG